MMQGEEGLGSDGEGSRPKACKDSKGWEAEQRIPQWVGEASEGLGRVLY